jgi:hypothetical protein
VLLLRRIISSLIDASSDFALGGLGVAWPGGGGKTGTGTSCPGENTGENTGETVSSVLEEKPRDFRFSSACESSGDTASVWTTCLWGTVTGLKVDNLLLRPGKKFGLFSSPSM